MKTTFLSLAVAVLANLGWAQSAPKNELAFELGGLLSRTRSTTPSIEAGSGVGFQVNYGRRVFGLGKVALYGEIQFLASPLREVSSVIPTATRNFASLYITPGVRVKFWPAARVSPYFAIGGGYADYEQSTSQIDGKSSSVPRELARGVFDFGGGVDVQVWRFVALRGEARDFFTGSPAYGVPAITGGQHNVVATAGFVLRWH